MVIPLIGPILFSDIDRELNRDVVITETSLGAAVVELRRDLLIDDSITRSLRGWGNFIGNQQWFGLRDGPGLYEFIVPDYRSMHVIVQGGGGGGGAGSTTSTGPRAVNGFVGSTGEFRTTTPLIAYGGTGGLGGGLGGGTNGIQGNASGGDLNSYVNALYSFGGNVSTGSIGDPGTVDISGTGGRGGGGGYTAKIFTRDTVGAPVPGTTIIVSVGRGGQSGSGLSEGGSSIVFVRWTARLLISPFTYDYPGIYQFLVPNYNSSLTVQIRGTTGGGGAARSINGSTSPTNGTAGGDTSFAAATPLVISGSGGGRGGGFGVTGQKGTAGVISGFTGSGIGQGPNRILGGLGATGTNGNGGEGGDQTANPWGKTYTRGAAGSPVPGTTIEVRVGAGGQNGDPDLSGVYDGQNGSVYIFWS